MTARLDDIARAIFFLCAFPSRLVLERRTDRESCLFSSQACRPESVVLMGKNTLMRKCITNYCKAKGDDTWMILSDKLIGNVGIIFTKGDLLETRKKIQQFVVPAPARIGAIAPVEVVVPAGPTGMEPSQTSFFQTPVSYTHLTLPTILLV